MPLTPSSISSVAALSSPATTTLGVARRGGLHDDHAVALAARGQQHAQRAAHLRARAVSACGEAAGRDRSPAARARRSPRRAPSRSGPSPKNSPRRPVDPLAAQRHRGDRRAAPASRGSAAREQHQRIAPRAGPAAAASRRTARAGPSPGRAAPPRAGARRAAREKQKARWGTRAHSRCTSAPTRPPSAAEVFAPVVAAPDLEPVDHQLEARAAARTSAGGEQREVGERAGVHDVVAAAVAQQVHEHAEPEHQRRQDPPAPAGACTAPSAAPPLTTRTRGSICGALAALPLAQRQVGDLVALRAERSARLRYQRSAPPTV